MRRLKYIIFISLYLYISISLYLLRLSAGSFMHTDIAIMALFTWLLPLDQLFYREPA